MADSHSDDERAAAFDLAEVALARRASGGLYREFLRVPALSAGLYELAAGSEDPQRPHAEDEVYYVLRGRAELRAGGRTYAARAGAVLYVAAGVEHRFRHIEENLVLLVVFAPAESAA